MASLTAKQEAFCQLVHKGEKQSDAYRQAYDPKCGDKAVWERSCRLMANDKVVARLQELRQPTINQARYSLEEHLDYMRKLSVVAIKNDSYADAIRAEELRAKALGFYVEKVDVRSGDRSMSPPQPVTIQIVGVEPGAIPDPE